MNRRILQLAASHFPRDGEGNICATPEIIAEFAESIVRECVRVIDDSTPVYSPEDQQEDFCQGTLNGYQSALLEIKEHFGVGE